MNKRKIRKFLLFSLVFIFLFGAADLDSWKDQIYKFTKTKLLLNRLYYKKIDEQKVSFSAIRGMLSTLDPHSSLLDPDSYKTMKEDQTGKFYGIGVQILKIEDRLTVITPLEGTSAYELGIQAGDVIVEVEGVETKKISQNEAVRLLRGPKGTYVNVKIKREGYNKLLDFKIKRTEIPLRSIRYFFIDPYSQKKIGVIVIVSFNRKTLEEFEEAISKLKKQNIQALILDLRYNGGGDVRGALGVSEQFLSEGKVIVSTKGRRQSMNQVYKAKKNNQYENIPLVVLVNKGSASASEIVAGAIQDHNKGVIIGQRTWGKGLVQTLLPVDRNIAIALTTARYYTPSGKMIQRNYSHIEDYLFLYDDKENPDVNTGGIVPDIKIEPRTLTIFAANLRSKGLFFGYANNFVKGKTGLKNKFSFEKNKSVFYLKGEKFDIYKDEIPEAIVKDFKEFIKERGEKFKKEEFSKSKKSIKLQLRRNIASRMWSDQEGFVSTIREDPYFIHAREILRNRLKK